MSVSMAIAAVLCAVMAALRVLPDRSMFFEWESVSLNCPHGNLSLRWTIMRNTSTHTNQEGIKFCSIDTNESNCIIDLHTSDSGEYWCESGERACSEAVTITVTAGSVILESPVLPVTEGSNVTLICRRNHQEPSSSNLSEAAFYKDGVLMGSSSTGQLTLQSVSTSEQGFYKCNMSGSESPDSRLTVRAETKRAVHPEAFHFPFTYVLLPVVVVACLLLSCAIALCVWRNRKDKTDRDVLYSDVVFTQERKQNWIRDIATRSTFHTKVKPGT